MNVQIKHYNLYKLIKDLHNNEELRNDFRTQPLKILKKYNVSQELIEPIIAKDALY